MREFLRAFLRAEQFVRLTPFDPISLPFSDEEPTKGDSEQAVLQAQEPGSRKVPLQKARVERIKCTFTVEPLGF